MTIQAYLREGYLRGLLRPDTVRVPYQAMLRRFNYERHLPVFYQYDTYRTHPYLKTHWYGSRAPVRWCNYKNAKLCHILGQETEELKKKGKSVVLDPNDNAWVFLKSVGLSTIDPAKNDIENCLEYLSNERVKAIILPSSQIVKQFHYLYGDSLDYKIVDGQLLFPRLIRILSESQIDQRISSLTRGKRRLKVLCLASNFYTKCVPEVVEAWKRLRSSQIKLTLVVPKLSSNQKQNLPLAENIEIIESAPLPLRLKNKLLASHDVSLCPTWIDCGGNVFEALENQHLVITTANHRQSLMEQLGAILVNPGIEYYDLTRYGRDWHDDCQYMEKIYSDSCGEYRENMISGLVEILEYIESSQQEIHTYAKQAGAVCSKFSLENSNSQLRNIYENALN